MLPRAAVGVAPQAIDVHRAKRLIDRVHAASIGIAPQLAQLSIYLFNGQGPYVGRELIEVLAQQKALDYCGWMTGQVLRSGPLDDRAEAAPAMDALRVDIDGFAADLAHPAPLDVPALPLARASTAHQALASGTARTSAPAPAAGLSDHLGGAATTPAATLHSGGRPR